MLSRNSEPFTGVSGIPPSKRIDESFENVKKSKKEDWSPDAVYRRSVAEKARADNKSAEFNTP